ncbi:DUF998 domain-containing protein [Dactylosporangium sp. NPDC000244]|uniref:DUF998 domain-containing protein n=1 Tax=Dactylosporangium sp. NPDC000244 TaxID=3154365 RepID=UPI00331EF9D3
MAEVGRPLLLAGAVAGPLFVTGVLAQAYTRQGFDPARHPLSSLALGDLGWVMIANFVICGVLALLGAAGLRRALAPGRASTWGPRLVGAGGAAWIVAGVFPPDPINGFPAGAENTATWHGAVHSIAPALAGIAGIIGYVIFARRFAGERERGWAAWTIAALVAAVAGNVLAAAASDFRAALLGQAVGAAWTTSLYARLLLNAPRLVPAAP